MSARFSYNQRNTRGHRPRLQQRCWNEAMMFRAVLLVGFASATVFLGSLLLGQQTAPLTPDIPAQFVAPQTGYDYVKREVMIPMRDGVKLHTVIVVPKGTQRAPILLTRTPYNASSRASRSQ